jgi:hypothetical protein
MYRIGRPLLRLLQNSARRIAAMDSKQDFITRGWRAGIARCMGAAISLGLVLAASDARVGVPLPVLAAAASELSLTAVVKQIAPSVVGIETTSHVAAPAGPKPGRPARKGTDRTAPAASRELHIAGSGVVFDARRRGRRPGGGLTHAGNSSACRMASPTLTPAQPPLQGIASRKPFILLAFRGHSHFSERGLTVH